MSGVPRRTVLGALKVQAEAADSQNLSKDGWTNKQHEGRIPNSQDARQAVDAVPQTINLAVDGVE